MSSAASLAPKAADTKPKRPGRVLPEPHDRPSLALAGVGNPAATVLPWFIQTKLDVGAADDPLEHEADRVAEAVMQPQLTKGQSDAGPIVRRACCAGCEEEQVQRYAGPSAPYAQSSLGLVGNVLAEPGRPLSSEHRAFFEPRLGVDLDSVRVHDDSQAARSAEAIGARAYTVGNHVVFAGRDDTRSSAGRKLMAHELAHVAQRTPVVRRQAGGSGSASGAPPAVVFHPGVNHAHAASGRWADVQANPNSGFWENRVCGNFSPSTVVGLAIHEEFSDKPLGLEHLNWYLGNGQGADFDENANLTTMLLTDSGVQALLNGLIPSSAPPGGVFTGHVKVEQQNYQIQDFRYAFGAIDRLDYEADFTTGILHCWFQDRYEWHPVYPGLYTAMPGDVARETNCVHAALVELKSGGAADYWMKGEARVPLAVIRTPAAAGPGPGHSTQ